MGFSTYSHSFLASCALRFGVVPFAFTFFFASALAPIASAQTAPIISALSPLSPLPVGASFGGSFNVMDSAGGSITKLRVHFATVYNGSDCAVDVGNYSGTQTGGIKVFAGCAELTTKPGVYHIKVEAWNAAGVQAVVPRATIQVGPSLSATAPRQAAAVSVGESTLILSTFH